MDLCKSGGRGRWVLVNPREVPHVRVMLNFCIGERTGGLCLVGLVGLGILLGIVLIGFT